MTEQTPARVADQATIQDAIDLRELTVIGVMTAADGPAALLRSGRGQVARVNQGTQVFGVTVAAIGETGVVVADRRGVTTALHVLGHSSPPS